MEDNHFSSISKNLKIGNLIISCNRKSASWRSAVIPFAGMAFYHPEKNKSDITLCIDSTIHEDRETLIFSSEECYPTYLFQTSSGDFQWIKRMKNGGRRLAFQISPSWNEFILFEDYTDSKGEQMFREFGALFSVAVLNHSACVFHGVVMEYEGKGILVMAPSGTGKTTHTRMWRDYKNALIINGDRCLCRKVGETWYAYGMPWSGSSGEYINRRVPIYCIVSLCRGNENRVNQMSIYDATIYLMQRIFAPLWSCEMQTKALDYCQEIAEKIPLLQLFCRPDFESVDVLERAILKL